MFVSDAVFVQTFTEEMSLDLNKTESPLDATLEQVIPGLHEWHQANKEQVGALHRKVDSSTEVT